VRGEFIGGVGWGESSHRWVGILVGMSKLRGGNWKQDHPPNPILTFLGQKHSVRRRSEVATNEKCRMNKANGFKMNSQKKRRGKYKRFFLV